MTSAVAPTSGTIEVRGLAKSFGRVQAVRGLDFTVEPGRITGFLGPNGAGKTTTLRMLLGLVAPTAGTATIGGRLYREIPDPVRSVGAVLEATSFHPSRRARSHLKMVAIAGGIELSRVDVVLDLVGLTGDAKRKVNGYSLGMRQRLELATALLGDPGVLILDEPSNGLDPQGIAWLREFLRHLAGEGRTILVSSHLLAEMAQTVDDVVILSQGQVRAQGPLSSLVAQAHSSMRVRSPEIDRLIAVVQGSGLSPRRVAIDEVVVDSTGPEQLGPILATNQVVIYGMAQESQNLESLFLELTTSVGGPEAPTVQPMGAPHAAAAWPPHPPGVEPPGGQPPSAGGPL